MRRIRPRESEFVMRDASAAAYTALLDQDLDLPSKPRSEIPSLSTVSDLTDLDDSALMRLFQQFTSWADYLAGQVACAVIDERAAQQRVDTAEAASMVRDWGGKSTEKVALAKARADADPVVQQARKALDEIYAYRKLVEVLATSVERDASIISREITRRTSFAASPRTTWSA